MSLIRRFCDGAGSWTKPELLRKFCMKEKELKKLSRLQLVDLLIESTEENERLKTLVQELSDELESRRIECRKAGNIAQAALQLNGVFEAAQQATEDYLNEIRQQTERAAP